MILVYIDETGDTGNNLKDLEQPIFVLGALLIPQEIWKELEKKYHDLMVSAFNNELPVDFELHTMDLVNGRNSFNRMSLDRRISLRDSILDLVESYKLNFLYRKIIKKDLQRYIEKNFGKGIAVDPYLFALPFICLGTEEILLRESDLGIFILDEHKKNYFDIEQSLKTLRLAEESVLHLKHVIEKGFFVDSSKSFAIQLVDLIIYYVRKFEEDRMGKKVSLIHKKTFPKIENMTIDLGRHHQFFSILDWLNNRLENK